MFGLLCLLWCLPFLKKEESNHKIFLLVSLLVISYGIIMEFVQKYFTRDRSFDVTDILADIAGSILGLVAVRIFATNLEIRAKNKPL